MMSSYGHITICFCLAIKRMQTIYYYLLGIVVEKSKCMEPHPVIAFRKDARRGSFFCLLLLYSRHCLYLKDIKKDLEKDFSLEHNTVVNKGLESLHFFRQIISSNIY